MRKMFCKLVSAMLIASVLLSIWVVAYAYNEDSPTGYLESATAKAGMHCETGYSDYEYARNYYEPEYSQFISASQSANGIDLVDIFSVYYTSGAAYYGYMFRLVDGANITPEENSNIQVLYLPKNLFWAKTLEDIAGFVDSGMILYVEPDYIIQLDPTPPALIQAPSFAPHAFMPVSDPEYHRQWNLDFIRGAAVWSWRARQQHRDIDTSGVVIAVVDSGIDRSHPDLVGVNILPGRNFVVNYYYGRGTYNTDDDCGHGTAVTGVIAARRGNAVGIASMCRGAAILPLRVFYGDPGTGRASAVANAILHASAHCVDRGRRRADIINLSLYYTSSSQTLVTAVNQAAGRGILMIAAVGNNNRSVIRYPAGLGNVIGVGAVDSSGERWDEGPNNDGSNYNTSVFITAPGAMIPVLSLNHNSYPYRSGTSYAAPHITALAAIAKWYNPSITQAQFENLLRRSTLRRGTPGSLSNAHGHSITATDQLLGTRVTPRGVLRDNHFGYGTIDAGFFLYNLRGVDFFDFGAHHPWAQVYIEEVARYGIMHGRGVRNYAVPNRGLNSQGAFSPGANMWRLEFPMALARLHELNTGNIPWVRAEFSDVDHSSRFPFNYSRHVAWTSHYSRNIVRGVTADTFNPGGYILRLEAAAMLQRYATYLATPPAACSTAGRLNNEIASNIAAAGGGREFLISRGFPDTSAEHLPDWAVDYVAWAVGAGLLEGRAIGGVTSLAARGYITRAEGAAMFCRFRRIFLRGTFIFNQNEVPSGGGQGLNMFSTAGFNTGGTPSHPASPAIIEPVSLAVGDNIVEFLTWFSGGALANGPVRAGYVFRGWYLDSAFTVPVTSETTV
ncbi:MAG: S8 family serine peptidase, partial [Oscillospiraceae bacterium]|nr:S8 family serine peptidase [Oscillospiraceae bacterium]